MFVVRETVNKCVYALTVSHCPLAWDEYLKTRSGM